MVHYSDFTLLFYALYFTLYTFSLADDNTFNPFASTGSDSDKEPVMPPQQSSSVGGGEPPDNLPFKDLPQTEKAPAIGGSSVYEKRSPIVPPSPPPLPQRTSPHPLAGVSTPPPVQSKIEESSDKPKEEAPVSGPLILRSSIRTMRDDFAALQRGQSPAGVKTEKVAEQQPKEQKSPVQQQAPIDDIYSQVELGEIEMSRNLQGEKPKSFRLARPGSEPGSSFESSSPPPSTAPIPSPVSGDVKQRRDFAITDRKPLSDVAPRSPRAPRGSSLFDVFSNLFKPGRRSENQMPTQRVPGYPPAPGAGVRIPQLKKVSISPKLVGLASIVIMIFGFVWFLFIRQPSQSIVFESPTPESTFTPTPVPDGTQEPQKDSLTAAIGEIGVFVFPSSADPLSTFNNFVQSLTISPKEIKAYSIEDETGTRVSFDAFLAKFLVTIPQNVASTVNTNDFILLVYSPEANGSKEAGLLIRSNDSIKTSSALRIWEGTLSEDLNDILNFDPQRAATAGFLDNVYKGVSIRYRNFPLPVDTLDYAVVTMPSGDHYLIIINSRESIYSLIDKFLAN